MAAQAAIHGFLIFDKTNGAMWPTSKPWMAACAAMTVLRGQECTTLSPGRSRCRPALVV